MNDEAPSTNISMVNRMQDVRGDRNNISDVQDMPPQSSSASDDQTSHGIALTAIPSHLRIKVLYADDSVIVIDKPSNLRSVPGHANPATREERAILEQSDKKCKKRLRNEMSRESTTSVNIHKRTDMAQRRTSQEAWVAAIRTFAEKTGESTQVSPPNQNGNSGNDRKDDGKEKILVEKCLWNLACTPNLACIPRKRKLFAKYCQKNQRRIFHSNVNEKSPLVPTHYFFSIVNEVYSQIEERQRPMLNLPEPTSHEESALGQLIILGFDNKRNKATGTLPANKEYRPNYSKQRKEGKPADCIFVVHRLDCETSGVMVFARKQEAASVLSRAWRERDQVEKTYLARIDRWPPWQEKQQSQGSIDLPLAPSQTERIKWEVQQDGSGKPSKTLWKIQKSGDTTRSNGLILILTPVTGRTHQLRIHCAAVGSGIEGDSLYGDNLVEWKPKNTKIASNRLCLHAQKLRFLHPETGEKVEFISSPPW